MPKILNLTVEQKAERYASTHKKAVNLTVQEKADKYDEIRRKDIIKCKLYAHNYPERVNRAGAEYYEKNKEELNKKSCIRLKKKYVSKKAVPESTEL